MALSPLPSPASDVALVGFGYSGLMVLAQIVRRATRPLHVRVVADDFSGLGVAYATDNPLHLLNVRAFQMGAWAEAPEDFAHWLATDAGQAAQADVGMAAPLGPLDFAPRLLYGRYLTEIRAHTLAEAARKAIRIDWHAARATALRPTPHGWEVTATDTQGNGQIVTAAQLVLASGHRPKRVFAHLAHPDLVQQPWQITDAQIRGWQGRPVVLMGLGLTAVDMLMQLRRAGYADPVLALSRSGRMPQPHAAHPAPAFAWENDPLMQSNPLTLLELLRSIRRAIRATHAQGGDWRSVVDGLRPHSTALWQRLSVRDQTRFLGRLNSLWGVYRHRMAPEIAAMLAREEAAGRWRTQAFQRIALATDAAGALALTYHPHAADTPITLTPAAILNCTGVELRWDAMGDPLFDQLVREGIVTPHPTGLGVSGDASYRLHPAQLYGIGPLWVGARCESIAIPELRHQAAQIAQALLEKRE